MPTEQPASPFPTEQDDVADDRFGDLIIDEPDQLGITVESGSPTLANSLAPSEAPLVESSVPSNSLVPTILSSEFSSTVPSSDSSDQPSVNLESDMPSVVSSSVPTDIDGAVINYEEDAEENEEAETLSIVSAPVSEPSEQPAPLPTTRRWWNYANNAV